MANRMTHGELLQVMDNCANGHTCTGCAIRKRAATGCMTWLIRAALDDMLETDDLLSAVTDINVDMMKTIDTLRQKLKEARGEDG